MSNFVVKAVLGLVAASSFAIAFGQEKISQYIPFNGSSSNSSCLNQFYREIPPYLVKTSLNKHSYPLCYNGFNVMYSGVSKTPLWVAESLTVQRLSTKIKREDNFHEESRVSSSHRATLADYRGSGYDRGHMAPNADMSNKEAQFHSFSLANMVPQSPKNNQQVWRELEEATRAIVTKQKNDMYVITGPVFSGKKLKTIGDGVIVPTGVFKAIYIPKTDVIGVYYAPNDSSLRVKIMSVCQLEEEIGINLFPQLTAEQKRNTYQLPLKATQVKANQKIEYLQWDAESQCAEDVASKDLQALQKQFVAPKSSNMGESTSSSSNESGQADQQDEPKLDESTQDIIIKRLIEIVLQYLLQFFK